MAMLEPGDILIDCTGSKSLLRDHWRPGRDAAAGREHVQYPARIRARHHLPVRPGVRLQRVLQVLQEHREPALQVHSGGPPHVLRRQHQPRDGHRQHHRRGLRGDAVDDSTASGFAATSPASPESMDRFIDKIKQETARRDSRRPGDHPDTARSVPGSQCDQPAVARGGTGDHPFARSPVFLVGDSAIGLAVLPVDFAGLRVCDVPRGTHRAARPVA